MSRDVGHIYQFIFNVMEFGEKIKVWGKNNFVTLRNFAKELNIDESSLQRYITGKTSPGKDFFEKLVRLGCDINWLLSSESNLLIKEPEEKYNNKEDTNYKDAYILSLEKRIEELTKHIEDLRLIINKQNGGQ